eukprot:6280289-Prymnesium_polylepis.1
MAKRARNTSFCEPPRGQSPIQSPRRAKGQFPSAVCVRSLPRWRARTLRTSTRARWAASASSRAPRRSCSARPATGAAPLSSTSRGPGARRSRRRWTRSSGCA